MPFRLPPLPYRLDALEPHISAETLALHHGRHHRAYVDRLNELTADTEFADADLGQIVLKARGAVYQQAAQVWNHTFYWNGLSPNGGGEPAGPLRDAIAATWGSLGRFRDAFAEAVMSVFGSGWVFLAHDPEADWLVITREGAAGNPMGRGYRPLLTCDVWEHAYYVDCRNRRDQYIESFWQVVNWPFVERNFLDGRR